MSVRVAVWGLGRHVIKNILPAISRSKGVVLYGVCSRDAEIVNSCATTWKCCGWTDSTAMLADLNVDAVFVATPTGLHVEHGTRVLAANKHLWCEKPLATTLSDTLQLLALSQLRNLVVCEGHMFLYHSQFKQLFEFVSKARLGKPQSVTCRFGIPLLEHKTFRDNPTLGGSALLDVGCYPIAALLALFPTDTFHVRYSEMSSLNDSEVDTAGHAAVELSNGVRAMLEWKTNSSYRNEIDIWGESGSLFTDKIFSKPTNYVPTFHFRNLHGQSTMELGEASDHFVLMIESFRDVIGDQVASDREQAAIAQRARLLDMIRCLAAVCIRANVKGCHTKLDSE